MKKLSLLMFAILILGCDTDTTLVEEPEPIIEEPPPVLIEEELSHHPLIAHGTVKNGQVNVDPELVNAGGFHFRFTKDFLRYQVRLEEKEGDSLNSWDTFSAGSNFLQIRRLADFAPLAYDTEYNLVIYTLDSDCDSSEIAIQFRTKPWKPGIERPAPVIQERIPVAPSGERFRFDIAAPAIVASDVADGEANVDPEPLNENGIQFEWDVPIRNYKIDLGFIRERPSVGYLAG